MIGCCLRYRCPVDVCVRWNAAPSHLCTSHFIPTRDLSLDNAVFRLLCSAVMSVQCYKMDLSFPCVLVCLYIYMYVGSGDGLSSQTLTGIIWIVWVIKHSFHLKKVDLGLTTIFVCALSMYYCVMLVKKKFFICVLFCVCLGVYVSAYVLTAIFFWNHI